MPEPPFKRVPPGGSLPASETNRALSAVEYLSRITGQAGLTVTQGPAGPLVIDPRTDSLWVLLTGEIGGGLYAGVELVEAPGQVWLPGQLAFAADRMVLSQVNKVTGLQPGTIGHAWPSPAGDCYNFEVAGSAGAACFPKITRVTNVCLAKDGNGIVVMYQTFDFATCTDSPPLCVENPTGCCDDHCDCNATDFLVLGTGFTGVFAAFSCPTAASCCAGALPAELCLDIGTASNPTAYASAVPVVWDVTAQAYRFSWLPYASQDWWRNVDLPGAVPQPPCDPTVAAVLLGLTGHVACVAGSTVGHPELDSVWYFDPAAPGDSSLYQSFADCSFGPTTLANLGDPYGAVVCGDPGGYESCQSSLTCSPFKLVMLAGTQTPAGFVYFTFTPCAGAPTPGGGFNNLFSLAYEGNGTYTFICPNGDSVTIGIGSNCIAALTFRTAGGDVAVYVEDVSGGCCGTLTFLLVSSTSPADSPPSIQVEGVGCESGSGSGPPTGVYWCVALTHPAGSLCSSGCYPEEQLRLSDSPPHDVGKHVYWGVGGGLICSGTITAGPYMTTDCDGNCDPSGGGVAVVSLASGVSSGSVMSFTLTGVVVPAGVLIVGADLNVEFDGTALTVTFAGTPMALAPNSNTNLGLGGSGIGTYWLHVAAPTTGNIVATLAAGSSPVGLSAVALTGLASNTLDVANNISRSTGAPTVTVSVAGLTAAPVEKAVVAFFLAQTPQLSWQAPFVDAGQDVSDALGSFVTGSEVTTDSLAVATLNYGTLPTYYYASIAAFK